MSDRFYADKPLYLGDVALDGPEAHHLAHVRRFVAGEQVILFNGDGKEYTADITAIGKKRVDLHITKAEAINCEINGMLHIGSAMPKGDRGDFLIEKLTELGVTDFTPLVTDRSIVQPKATIVEKLERAVIEASKQCGRNVLMRIHPPCRLNDWFKRELPDRRWILHPGTAATEPSTWRTPLAVAIGPEGGFTEDEVAAAVGVGFEKVSLKRRILRVETAAMAIAALIGIASTE